MSNVYVDKQKIDILANAIAAKSGESVTMTLDEMVSAVDGIQTGGGGTPTLETVTKTYTPSTSAVTDTITPSAGYDGIGEVDVTVSAIPTSNSVDDGCSIEFVTSGGNRKARFTPWIEYNDDGYVAVTQGVNNFSTNIYNAVASGTTVTPTQSSQTIGGTRYMMEGAVTVAAMPSGSATPAASISGTSATVSTGTNTLTLSKTVSNTPQVSAGYVSAGTAGNSNVSLTANVTTKAAATITPTTSNQTIASGTYLTGTQTISGDANLVAGNIKSGTTIFGVEGTYQGGVTPTGTITLSSNTTGVDVAQYAFADVAVPWTWMGEEPTVVNSSFYSDSYLLGSTSYNGWTGSTTAKIIVASVSAGTFVASAMNEYEYLINWQMDVVCTLKSTATTKAIPIRECANVWQLVTRRPSSLGNITADNFNGNTAYTYFTAPWLKYYNTSGSSTYTWSNSYGIYGTVQTPTFSNTTADSPTVTLKTPIWYARCSSTYFATGRVGDIDQTATTLKRTCKIYRVKKGTPPREMYEGLVSIINNPL